MATNSNAPLNMLKEKRSVLIDVFLNGNAPDFLGQHTRIIDDYFLESYEQSAVGPRINMNKSPYAIIALGGYGRQEQCIHSDIDLLFLFENRVPDEATDLISEMVYPLWDIGLDVGHATRSLEDCIAEALEDIEVLTALLDARFLCGMSSLYSKLMDLLRRRLVDDHSFDLIEGLINRNQARHGQFGDSTYLLEPNMKEGQGGLRDYHTLIWIGRVKNHLTSPRDLEYYGWLSHEEYQRLKQALSFIWHTRNHLHHVVGRKCDQLYFDYQEELADILDYQEKDGQQPVERFLGELHRHMSFIKQHYRILIYELENENRRKRKKWRSESTRFKGIIVEKGMLSFVSSEAVNRDPMLLMQIFEESAFLTKPLSAESRRMVKGFLHLMSDSRRRSKKMRQSFESILLTPAPIFNVLEAMSETDFLQAYISQFNQVVNRIQYDEYHLHPVDRHLLRTVQTVKRFGTDEDPSGKEICGKLYKELSEEERIMLLWAALLHDIGKGEPGGSHSQKGETIVREILSHKGYDEETTDTVAFLVRQHLLLAKIATRRDIQDEETAIFCARIIKDASKLKMLYLLTVADSFATGPKAWNSWTGSLMEGLFFNILSTLKNGELTSNEAVEMVEEKKRFILSSASEEERRELEQLLSVMSPRYLLYTGAEDIARHIRLYNRLGTANFVWQVDKNPDSNTRRVTVCAKDCPGLFSRIAGTFTLNGVNILDVQVFTWRNNIALDVFDVEPPPDDLYETQKWEHAETDMESALIGTLDLDKALKEKVAVYSFDRPKAGEKPHKVIVDNESSSFFTIIEVFTYDFPGLLFGITNALFHCRLDVWVAKIATKVDQVVDVFYVRDFDGQKADAPHQVAAITSAVEDFLNSSYPVEP